MGNERNVPSCVAMCKLMVMNVATISKYKRFSGKKGCHSDLLNAKVCLKLSDSVTFQSPKSVVYDT